MNKKDNLILKLENKCSSENELYFKLISIHNVVNDWGLTYTQINILVYLIRFGYSEETKKIICKEFKISRQSLNVNLSYLRRGKMGKKRIQKLIESSIYNKNNSLLKRELKDIDAVVKNGSKKLFIVFEDVVS